MIDSTVTSRKLDTQNKLPPLFKNVIIFSFFYRGCVYSMQRLITLLGSIWEPFLNVDRLAAQRLMDTLGA